jgi:hypothetical protein
MASAVWLKAANAKNGENNQRMWRKHQLWHLARRNEMAAKMKLNGGENISNGENGVSAA